VCDAEVNTTTVCNTGTLNNVVRAAREYTWTAFAQDSTSTTAWTAKIYSASPGSGYDTAKRALINSTGDITTSNQMFSWTGLMGDLWVVLGGTQHATDTMTIKIKGCPLSMP
jgi:hypothetical protein